jgi:universal stress protein A
MKVLMATDGSKPATLALRTASSMLASDNRVIELMYVVPSIHPKRQGEMRRLQRRGEKMLQKSKEFLFDAGVNVRLVLKTGSPIGMILGASYKHDVTLIAAASHRNDSTHGLGPVSGQLVEHAPGCILIAREGRNETGLRILAAVDGSDGSLRAVDKLVELIDLNGAMITFQHVVETPWLSAGLDQEWLGYEDEEEENTDPQAQLEEEFTKEADALLEAAAERLPVRVGVTTQVSRGLPADEIISEATQGEYDLIVIGTSGATDLKHRLLGSVASKVVWNAPCCVLLVRPAADQ